MQPGGSGTCQGASVRFKCHNYIFALWEYAEFLEQLGGVSATPSARHRMVSKSKPAGREQLMSTRAFLHSRLSHGGEERRGRWGKPGTHRDCTEERANLGRFWPILARCSAGFLRRGQAPWQPLGKFSCACRCPPSPPLFSEFANCHIYIDCM